MDRKRSPGMLTPLLLAGLVLLGFPADGSPEPQDPAAPAGGPAVGNPREEPGPDPGRGTVFHCIWGMEAAGNFFRPPVTGGIPHPGNEGKGKGSAPPGTAPAPPCFRRTIDAGQPL